MKSFLEKLRAYFLAVLTAAAFCLGSYRLMKIQIVNGSSYLEKSITTSTGTQVIEAPRGEIVDSDGEPLVSNKSCFNVIVDKAFFPSDNEDINRVILKTAAVLEEEDIKWNDILPMSEERPFVLDDTAEGKVTEMRKHIGVQIYATPDQCLDAMCDNYGISDEYTPEEKRRIAGIRYTMDMRSFSVSNTYTFAEDVSMDTVIKLKELSFELEGIDVSEDAVRTYGEGDVVPHLIGTTGAISAEEYADLKSRGYALNDTVGKSGIELAMESTLRGTKGTRTIEMQDGTVVYDAVTEEAVPGNTVKLTIDSDYQRNVQTILENHIIWLNNQKLPDASGTEADAGALVVLDAKTGALLAAATAPTYNLNDYISDYQSVASGENSPLTNRAVNGLYRPGSTFKTVTATAALNENVISPYTEITCNGVYNYWEDYKPKCTGFHGKINVVTALKESCNIFFYDTGRITGIDTIRSYAEMFGLGGEAGLETGRGIDRGYISCPETYDMLGLDWQAGNIVQAAIGQSETAVTPLQMAAQAMTIANKGVRYRTYMVDSIYTYNMESLVEKTTPAVAQVIPDKTGYTFDTVTEGMKQAAAFTEYNYPKPKESDYYTGEYLLTELPYEAAIKTGTPQMTSSEDTGSAFIGFYPADDPQIAFAGFIEHGEYSKFMVRQLIEAYYDGDYSIVKLAPDGSVIEDEEDIAEDEETAVDGTELSENESTESGDEPENDTNDGYNEEYPAVTEPEAAESTEETASEESVSETEAPETSITVTEEAVSETTVSEALAETIPETTPETTSAPVTEPAAVPSEPTEETTVPITGPPPETAADIADNAEVDNPEETSE